MDNEARRYLERGLKDSAIDSIVNGAGCSRTYVVDNRQKDYDEGHDLVKMYFNDMERSSRRIQYETRRYRH